MILRILKHVPMPLIAILIGLIVGLAVWGVLDQIQSQAVKAIFDRELQARLELRARESLLRFNQYLTNYVATTRLLANHRRLAQYLEPLFWFPEDKIEPVRYESVRPFWLPEFFERDAVLTPSHVLLVDNRGQVREIYQARPTPMPLELTVQPWSTLKSDTQAALVRFGEAPYLLVSNRIEDSGGYKMGSLAVLVPIDAAFLRISAGMVSPDSALVAVVDAEEQRILASNEPHRLPPGSMLDQWQTHFMVTSQSLPAYEGSDSNMLFATFIPQHSVEKMSRHVMRFERRQRLFAALAFIFVFTLVIYLVSARLNRVLRRMSLFAQRALGIEQPGFRHGGNQLLLLEEWIQQFVQLVLRAREEMRREHESEIRETEALKAAIMEASLDSIVTLDCAGRIVDFNPTAERTLRLDLAGGRGTSFVEHFLEPEARESFAAMLRASSARAPGSGTGHARGELLARRADGSRFPVEMSIVPIALDTERFYTLYMHDVTKRRQAEREIKGLARFASESPNPILRVDDAGLILYANAASQPLTQAWRAEAGAFLPSPWREEVSAALESGQNREREDDLEGRIYSLLFVPIQEFGYVNIYGRDITAVRRAEQESRQHQAELVHVCRLSTLGEVATGMAHELNQPLSAIVNYANGCIRRLQSGIGESEALIAALGQIASQAQRASEIIRRLRALVGKQAPARTEVDLNYLVREVCGFVEFDTERLGLKITLELTPHEVPVNVDLVQIEQVLLNLVRNALDALAEVPEERRALTIATAVTAAEAEVSVCDSGPGIPPERLPKLFDPFFTTKETGMGMGLAISATIVTNHEGTIRAESAPGQGACFRIRLPLARAVENRAEEGG